MAAIQIGEPSFGLLDTNIPAQAALAPIKGMGAVNALAAQNLQNEASRFEMQNALAEQEAYKRAAQGEGSVTQNLMGAGLGGKAAAYQKLTADAQKAQGDALESRIKQSRFALENVRTPEQYLQWHIANHQDPVMGQWLASRGITPQQSMQNIQSALQVPGGFDKLLTESKIGSEKMIEMLNKQQERQQGTVPAGYRMTPAGNLEAIPGGPTTTPLAPKELQKREAAYPQAKASITGYESKADKFIKDIDELLENKSGLDEITGYLAGRTEFSAISKEGREALAKYNQIIAKGGFQALQDIRDMSKTGGALGNISNQEGKQLQASFASVDRRQDADSVRAALEQVKNDIEGSKTRIRETFDEQYAYKNATPAAPTGGGGGNQTWKDRQAEFNKQRGGR